MLFAAEVDVIDISFGGISLRADRRFDIDREYSVKFKYKDEEVCDHMVYAYRITQNALG